MKRTSLVLIILVFVLSIAGSVIAQDETLTVLCTPQDDWCVAMTEAFEEETGIDTSFVRMSSGEALARIRATADDPEFSIWWGGPADAFIAAKEEGLLEQYDSENAEVIDPALKDEEGYWTGVYVGALGFCSNPDVLEELGVEAPTSWADLLDPAFEENITMAHPATSGTAFTAFWTAITLSADYLEEQEEGTGYDEDGAPTEAAVDMGFEYFSLLNNNILQYNRSGSAAGRQAGAGEIAVGIIFSHDCVKFQEEVNDELISTFPEEGTGYEIGGMAILANAPELEAAQLWYEWALTADAQAIGATVNALQLPTNPDTPVSELSVNLAEVLLVDYNFEAAGMSRNDLVERFDEEIAPTPAE